VDPVPDPLLLRKSGHIIIKNKHMKKKPSLTEKNILICVLFAIQPCVATELITDKAAAERVKNVLF
jgi:hypothetical protein